jgi:hypothetical protein
MMKQHLFTTIFSYFLIFIIGLSINILFSCKSSFPVSGTLIIYSRGSLKVIAGNDHLLI